MKQHIISFFIKNRQSFGAIILVILLFFVIIPVGEHLNRRRSAYTFKYGVYGIALVTEYRSETRSSHYRYKFIYNNVEHESRYYYVIDHNPEVGKRYFVLIDPKHPMLNNYLLADFPVPDSIKEAPPEGWKECPGVSKEQIREFLDHY